MPHRFCERCKRVTNDGHLWCPYSDCPAEHGFPVFVYGDYLGDIKITKLIRVWRWAALYEAERNEQPLWVKVAHNNPESQDRLRREAKLLESLKPKVSGSKGGLLPVPRSLWLSILPATPGDGKRPFGEITVAGEPKVFAVFEPVPGSIMTDVMLENPQPWHREAAWVTSTLADALRPLAANNLAHLNVSPEVVALERDGAGHWRPTLLDMGWLVDSKTTSATLGEVYGQLEPAYSAPEVQSGSKAQAITPAADAYSLGLLYHQLLSGKPGYDPELPRDDKIRAQVVNSKMTAQVDRPELEQAGVVGIVQRAIATRDRFQSVTEFGKELTRVYGNPPPEKRPWPMRARLLATIAMGFLITLAILALFVIASMAFGR